MAPRRSSQSDGNSQICDGAFAEIDIQFSLAYSVLFSLVFLLLFAALFFVRKRSSRTGQKLMRTAYISAVVMMLVSNMIDTIATVLISCRTSDYFTYLNMLVASNILYALATWCLLFTAVYTLNTMLAQSHSDHFAGQQMSPVYKVVPLAIVAVMFLLVCGSAGLWSYNSITRGLGSEGFRGPAYEASQKLKLVVRVLYLVGVCAGAFLAGLSVMKMRAMRVAGGGLIGWVGVLFFSMLIWNIMSLIGIVNGIAWSWEAGTALSYIQGSFQALAFVTLMGIAKHPSWESKEHVVQQEYSPVSHQHMTTTTAYEGAQQNYYQPPAIYEAPVYAHAK